MVCALPILSSLDNFCVLCLRFFLSSYMNSEGNISWVVFSLVWGDMLVHLAMNFPCFGAVGFTLFLIPPFSFLFFSL